MAQRRVPHYRNIVCGGDLDHLGGSYAQQLCHVQLAKQWLGQDGLKPLPQPLERSITRSDQQGASSELGIAIGDPLEPSLPN